MPIRINDTSVINHFKEIIPGAAQHDETYLQVVASEIRVHRPPATMSVDSLITDGFRSRKVRCLVVEPTEPRLRPYWTAHYATVSGGNLTVGWYLVGGEKAAGFQVGAFSFGGPTELDVEEVMTIVETVHDYAVLPAIEQITTVSSYGVNPT